MEVVRLEEERQKRLSEMGKHRVAESKLWFAKLECLRREAGVSQEAQARFTQLRTAEEARLRFEKEVRRWNKKMLRNWQREEELARTQAEREARYCF